MNELAASAVAASINPTFGAWNEVRLAYERADAAMEACPMEPWEPFSELAGRATDLKMDLFLTPAPTVVELAYKMSLYVRDNTRHLVRADEIGKALEADALRLASAGQGASDAQWGKALTAFEAVNAALKRRGLADDQVDHLAKIESDAGQMVMALPARTIADVATKLRIQMKLAMMIEHDDLAKVLADLDRLAQPGPQENPALTDAFATYLQAMTDLRQLPLDGDETKIYAKLDPAQMTMKTEPAFTLAGVAMKLRHAMAGLVPETWGTQALFDPTTPEFETGFEMADFYQQLIWLAIEDLDRIVEQGR